MRKIVAISLILLFAASAVYGGTGQCYRINGYKYYTLYSLCRDKDIEYCWDSVGRVAILKKGDTIAKIRIGSDRILINDSKLEDIGPPIYFHDNTVVVPHTFAMNGIDRIFKKARASRATRAAGTSSGKRYDRITYKPESHRIKTVVLDPGHGGKDPGAIGRRYKLKEKDINLDTAKRLKKLLKRNGLKVYMTRENDRFLSLEERAEYAARKKADLFISIHSNSSVSSRLKGFEVYYLTEKTDDSDRAEQAARNLNLKTTNGSIDRSNRTAEAIVYDMMFYENRVESRELARYIIDSAKRTAHIRKNSLRSAKFHVLNNFRTDMPAVLVELGYLSHRSEEAKLKNPSYRQRMAEAVKRGILEYRDMYEKTDGFTE